MGRGSRLAAPWPHISWTANCTCPASTPPSCPPSSPHLPTSNLFSMLKLHLYIHDSQTSILILLFSLTSSLTIFLTFSRSLQLSLNLLSFVNMSSFHVRPFPLPSLAPYLPYLPSYLPHTVFLSLFRSVQSFHNPSSFVHAS